MADVLDGNTSHAHYAPLSHQQTVQLCRHLQDQINSLKGGLDDVAKGVQSSHDGVHDLKNRGDEKSDHISELKDGLAATRALLDTTRKELGRTNNNVQTLFNGLEKSNENISQLRDALKLTNTNMAKLDQDLGVVRGLAKSNQDTLERRTSTDIDKLRADLSRTNLDLDQLREDEEQVKALVKEERESLRDTLQKCKGLGDDLATSGTRMNIIEERLGDACKDIKGNTNKIEDVNERLLQLHGDHERTATAGADLANSMKKVKVHVKHVHEHLDKTHNTGGDTFTKVEDNAANVADLTSKVQMLHNGLMSVTQGHGMLKNNVAQMQGELSHVAATAEKVKAGLKETSSILLPNINMDSVEARSATARHGSILQGHLTSPLFSPNASGKTKTPRPTSKSAQNGAPGSANFSAWT